MSRLALAALLCLSCWQPAAAAAVAQAAGSRSAPVSAVPALFMGVPVSGSQGLSQAGLKASLTGGLSVSAALTPAPAVFTAGVSAQPAVPAVALAAPKVSGTAGPVSPLASVSQVAEELSRTAAPRGGASSESSAPSPVLGRFFDGGVRPAAPVEPVDAASSASPAAGPALRKSDAPAAAKAQVPLSDSAKKGVRRALVATGIYKFGMEALNISMPLIALTVFGSAVWMATMAAAWGASMTVASMFAGGLVDRKPVQKVMAAALTTQAGAVAGIIGMLLLGVANPWFILPLYMVAGLSQGVVLTSRDTIPGRLLGRDQAVLSKFNAKVHMVYETSGTIAPLLVGLLIAKFGLTAGLLLQPPAYLLAAFAFYGLKLDSKMDLRHKFRPEDLGIKNTVKRVVSDIREGARIVLGSKDFRWLGFMILGPVVVHRVYEQIVVPMFTKGILGDPSKSGLIVSASNFGELVGAIMLLRVLMSTSGDKKPSAFRWVRAMALGTLAVWTLSSGLSLPVVMVAIAVMSTTWIANDISLNSYFQSRLSNASAGKAVGFLMAAELGTIMAVSYMLGFLFDSVSLAAGLVSVSVALTLLAAVFFLGYSKLKGTQPKA